MRALDRRGGCSTASMLAACFVAATVAFAQEKKEEEPFWAKGRPKDGVGARWRRSPLRRCRRPRRSCPKLTAPAGFKVEVYQSGILDARGLRRGDKGTIFVSSLFVGRQGLCGHRREGQTRRSRPSPSGSSCRTASSSTSGSLYVATPKQITRYDKIEDNLDKPPAPVDGLRQAARRHSARLEVHQVRAGRQALRARRRALQHLRAGSREVRADLPHQRGR